MNVAYIDLDNTKATCLDALGFEINIQKLINYLLEKSLCYKIYIYAGIDTGNLEDVAMYDELIKNNTKVFFFLKEYKKYFRKPKIISHTCSKCKAESVIKVNLGKDWKANCDVDMSMDITLDCLREKLNKVYIFTSDGDFVPVIKLSSDNATKVYIVADATKKNLNGVTISRFSTKLRKLVSQTRNISIVNIDDLKIQIQV
jgi:uncharacterized LabA/DUF88 family protein